MLSSGQSPMSALLRCFCSERTGEERNLRPSCVETSCGSSFYHLPNSESFYPKRARLKQGKVPFVSGTAQRNPVWKEARSNFSSGSKVVYRLGSRPKEKRILGRTRGVRKAPSEVAKQNTKLSTASFPCYTKG